MEYAACNIIYVDRKAGEDRLIRREDGSLKFLEANSSNFRWRNGSANGEMFDAIENLETLLKSFSEVHVCTTGKSCVSKLAEIHEASIVELIPTLVLLHIPYEDHLKESLPQSTWTPSPTSNRRTDGLGPDDADYAFYGLSLLRWIALDIQQQNLSKLVVPIAVVSGHTDSIPQKQTQIITEPIPTISQPNRARAASISTPLEQKRLMNYVDVGAADVLISPVTRDQLQSLAVHAYRAHKESLKDHRAILELKRVRKRSWVGVDDQKPYAYLREAMVSGLMDGICRLGGDDSPLDHVRLSVPVERHDKIEKSISTWEFSAHEFTDDELIHAAMLMLQHALVISKLEKWRISTENLIAFLVACRAAYNSFVPYHNFRHVIDVLQAIFHFLVRLGILPPYPAGCTLQSTTKSPIAALLQPFDALTLLVTAIGHDVGHPGVNNAFLVTLNAPLAQLYNDRSVLESFHCAAYSQILRRHWPAAFSDIPMRQLMISSILATDMGLHFDYMKKLVFLQEKLHENGGTYGWDGKQLEEYRRLACALLIKCADISNVARCFDVATKWTMILTDEFSRQAVMETDLGIPTALFAPPVREIVELGQSQVDFMNMFAIPLFQGVTDVMPAMKFCVDELNANKNSWKARIEEEQAKRSKDGDEIVRDGMRSPRAMSLAVPHDGANQRGPNHPGPPDKVPDMELRDESQKATPGPLDGIQVNDFQDTEFKRPSDSMKDNHAVELSNSSSGCPRIPAAYSTTRRSLKPMPCQLQISHATASTPGLLDHAAKASEALDTNRHNLSNGIYIGNPSIADAAFSDTPTPRPASKCHGNLRTSDITDGSMSAPSSSDWASQATSATTSKLPLSPSTQGTSITSTDSSAERATPLLPQFSRPLTSPSTTCPFTVVSQSFPDLPRPLSPPNPAYSDTTLSPNGNSHHIPDQKNGSTTIIETMRSLAKKPSRTMFRRSFWKRKASHPAPALVSGAGDKPSSLGDGQYISGC